MKKDIMVVNIFNNKKKQMKLGARISMCSRESHMHNKVRLNLDELYTCSATKSKLGAYNSILDFCFWTSKCSTVGYLMYVNINIYFVLSHHDFLANLTTKMQISP